MLEHSLRVYYTVLGYKTLMGHILLGQYAMLGHIPLRHSGIHRVVSMSILRGHTWVRYCTCVGQTTLLWRRTAVVRFTLKHTLVRHALRHVRHSVLVCIRYSPGYMLIHKCILG
eukprot:GEMP01130569.1.p2 GENE.GEMP01130569.1~~GEMP01130569.1.p2  ORF type:complete len:114 (-),score=5.22 GEMP01130569.1:161-502(-)